MQANASMLRSRCAAIFLLPIVAMVASASEARFLRTIALSDQFVPESPFRFGDDFERVLINEAGHVAILTQPFGSSLRGRIWLDEGTGLELVAHGNMQVPGRSAGETFGGFEELVLGNGGHIAFIAAGAVFSTKSGAIEEVFREDIAPFTASRLRGTPLAINSNGTVAFVAESVTNFHFHEELWSDRSGAAAIELDEGEPAPGIPGAVFTGLRFSELGINDAGHIALLGLTNPPGGGIWVDRGAGFDLVAGSSVTSPPGAPGTQFASLTNLSFHGSDDIGFQALLRPEPGGGEVSPDMDRGIWRTSNGVLQLVFREGDVAPGIPGGAVLSDLFFSNAQFNDLGDVAFISQLRGPEVVPGTDSSIWRSRGGTHELIAREGEQIPDGRAGVVFQTFALPALNAAGQVAFQAGLIDELPSRGHPESLWATDRSGALRLIAQHGQTIDVDSGPGVDLREILEVRLGNSLGGVGPGEGLSGLKAFNARGQIVFVARFVDGSSGVFVSDAATIPEPPSAIIFVMAIALPMAGRVISRGG